MHLSTYLDECKPASLQAMKDARYAARRRVRRSNKSVALMTYSEAEQANQQLRASGSQGAWVPFAVK